ncbi:ATP-binding protein [Liquorilactobacillus nagelii]|jgi:DNA replication protein DnaC|nr:ATP-binding protein [Liquorilactobacillus nagelii]MCI1700665.1 ATP-binding protein [Liquorilactobacillus nagelii]
MTTNNQILLNNLERLVHHVHVVKITGKSYRLRGLK